MLIRNKFNGFSFDGSRRAYLGGGGGGGGGSPGPSSQSVSQTTIPEYARPYVETLLGQASALTDINQNPYAQYTGQRVAGFSPMQAQAFQNIANQQVAGQIGEGSNLASQAGRTSMGAFGQGQQLGQAGLGYGGMGAGYGGQAAGMSGMGFGAGSRYEQMATSPGAQQAYMSPYMQNVVDYQKQQALRDYGVAQTGRQHQATAAGAFGGSRQAVQEAEANRALQNQLAGIQATGTQKAFEDAQKQMQFGADLGLRGLQAGYQGLGMGIQGAQTGLQGVGAATQAGQYGLQGLGQGLQAASTLGQLGQTQFGQQMAISDAMQKAGALQQAQQQQGLDIGYQDFMKQRNYPYQQLAFMSDMLRGLPLSQSAQQIYTAPPSAMSQLGGLGMTGLGIYGMSGGFRGRKGGLPKDFEQVKGYAVGGDIKTMSTEELQKLLDNPNLTPMEVEMIEKQLMIRRRMEMNPQSEQIMQQAGITSIPTGNMVPEEGAMAGGGIVAFAKGSKDAVEEDPVSNKEYREFLRTNIMERLKGLQGGTDPFAESKKQEADIRAQLAESKRVSPYEALAMAGLGTMAGTSRYGLTNLGLGGIEGLKTLGRSKAEQGQMEKLLMQQGVEREKAKYGRDIQNLNALQTSLGQMDAREIAAMNARRADAGMAEARRNTAQINAQRAYDSAVKAEKDNLFKQNKAKFNMDYTDPELDAQAVANVNKRMSPAMKSLLFPEGMPTIEAAPAAAPTAAPAASGAAKKGFDVVVQGKTYTFPTKEAADTFKQRAQAATTAPTR